MQQMQRAGRMRQMVNLVGNTVLLMVLAITAYRDWREKQIYLCVPIAAGIAGLMFHALFLERTIWDVLSGAAIGGVVVLLAWISRERIGVGDGLMLMVTGIFLGFWGNLELLFSGLMLAGLTALFLLVVKKKGRDYRVPFVPFLLVAFLFQLL